MSGSTDNGNSANQNYFNASLRHAVDIRRYTAGEAAQILTILEKADRELVHQLRNLLNRQLREPGRAEVSVARIRTMLVEIAAARKAVYDHINELEAGHLTDMAAIESRHEEDMIQLAVPVELTLASVSIKQIGSIVTSSPFEGRLLKDWFSTLSDLEQQRVQDAITIGLNAGETNEQIITRIIGTKAANFQDGILSISRRNAEAIVRTAANHVANQARSQVWDANRDIISEERWVSVLDGRTTPICQARDGQVFPIGVGPRPPAHFNCRSIMVAVLDGIGIIGERPFVRSTERRQIREVDFRDEARTEAGAEVWSSMSAAEKRAAVTARRKAWAAENIGQVPAATTYQEWLTKQPTVFQDQVLGPKRGVLFRKGELKLDQFVDRFGNSLTLEQLKELYPAAWARAGL